MTELDTLLADMRRKYQHAAEDGNFLKGEGLGKSILEKWIPEVETASAELDLLRARVEEWQKACADAINKWHAALDANERLRARIAELEAERAALIHAVRSGTEELNRLWAMLEKGRE